MSKKSPIHTLARELVDQFSNESGTATDRDKLSDRIHQSLHATIGLVSPQRQKNYPCALPVQVCSNTGPRQYNLYETIKRVQKCFRFESQFQAMGIAEDIVSALRSAGIGVNQVQLYLEPSIDNKTRKSAFQDLCKNLEIGEDGTKLPPETATLAIAEGLIPHPEKTWEKRLAMTAICRQPWNFKNNMVDFVAQNECYLWVFPPADHSETYMATMDKYWSHPKTASAEMGMGFSIIQPERDIRISPFLGGEKKGTYTRYNLFTPLWHWSLSQESTWRTETILSSRIDDGAPYSRTQLSDLLPDGLSSVPRIRACETCQTLFVDKKVGFSDIPTHCSCATSSPYS